MFSTKVFALNIALLAAAGVISILAIPGGYHPADIESEAVVNIVNYAVDKVDEMSNSDYKLGLEMIVSAEKQVVQGFNYKVSFIIHHTNCPKEGRFPVAEGEEDVRPSYCVVTTFEDCLAIVHVPLHSDPLQLTTLTCSPSTYERNFAHGALLPEEEPERKNARGWLFARKQDK